MDDSSKDSKDILLQAHKVRKVTLWGLALNLVLAVVKFSVGTLASCQALVADAVHSLADSFTDLAVLIGAPYWLAPADSEHPHGHGRIETMIILAIGTALGFAGLGLVWRALSAIQTPKETLPGWSAFAVAVLSVLTKEILYQWTANTGKRIRSPALIANAWHHRSDGLSSLPVAVAVVAIRLKPQWQSLDDVAALVVSLFILQAAWKILWPALKQLADTGTTQKERDEIETIAKGTDGVIAIHALRTRHIGPGLQIDLHVLVDPKISVQQGHAIAHTVKEKILHEGPAVVDVLVHVEPHAVREEDTL